MNKLNPPAITKQIDSLRESLAVIKSMYADRVRRNVMESHAFGKKLWEAREQCRKEQRSWTKELSDAGIPRRSACKDIRTYERWTSGEVEVAHIAQLPPDEALDVAAGRYMEESEGDDKPVSTNADREPGDDDPDQDAPAPPQTPSVFCRDCRINGPKKDCPACAEKRGLPPPPAGGGKKGGGATGPKQGQEVFEWSAWKNTYHRVARLPEMVVESFPDEKQTTEYHAVKRMLVEFTKLWKSWEKRMTKGEVHP